MVLSPLRLISTPFVGHVLLCLFRQLLPPRLISDWEISDVAVITHLLVPFIFLFFIVFITQLPLNYDLHSFCEIFTVEVVPGRNGISKSNSKRKKIGADIGLTAIKFMWQGFFQHV